MKTRHGFALVELAALSVVASLVAALLLVFGAETRRAGRLGEDIGKLRSIGSLTCQYAADNADQFWTFSWRAGESHSQWPDLNNATNDGQAVANQMVDILRRRAGRMDISLFYLVTFHINYSHVPLLDYTGRVPDETFISAADEHRLKWSRDPHGFDQGLYHPAPPNVPGDPNAKRWPYSASFIVPTAFYDKSSVPNRVTPAGRHNLYYVPGAARLGAKLLSDVDFPAHKVFVSDSNARHFGTNQPYCTHDQSRLPLLFTDGGVPVKAARESNPGWQPNNPASPDPTLFQYEPTPWEPGGSGTIIGRFRWTRGFLDGRDFGGPEACTGQPGCP
ncbi:MAG: type II secretion system protein [Phycisphaerales bacterium]|nr:type II secretion system protein [Phycisphaerales bacterium]